MQTWQVDQRHKPRLMDIFDHLHRHPELSWQEFNTRDFIVPILEAAGCRIRTFADHAGIVADWGEGQARVGLRADMDALWQELNGTFCANHSCGHDAHMTIALGTLFNLIDNAARMRGAVRLIFQPAEEKGTGARRLAEAGVLDDVQMFFGVHLRPAGELANGLMAPAIHHGACAAILGKIKGEDIHAGRPHLGANAIEVGAALVNALAALHLDPMTPYSIKLTRFLAGGDSTNIIPGNAQFSIDLRAQTNAQMARLVEKTLATLAALATTHGVEIEHTLLEGAPAAEVHPEAADIMARAIRESAGETAFHPAVVTGGGDDFHCYTIARPQLKATMLALGCDLRPGLHHPHMQFDHEAMFVAMSVLSAAVVLAQTAIAKDCQPD